jgi:hypothetical protein
VPALLEIPAPEAVAAPLDGVPVPVLLETPWPDDVAAPLASAPVPVGDAALKDAVPRTSVVGTAAAVQAGATDVVAETT